MPGGRRVVIGRTRRLFVGLGFVEGWIGGWMGLGSAREGMYLPVRMLRAGCQEGSHEAKTRSRSWRIGKARLVASAS